MKKLLSMIILFVVIISVGAYASAGITVEKVSENLAKVYVSSDKKIKVTGYTITKGQNVEIYYSEDNNGTNKDSITIDLSSVLKPYRIYLDNVNTPKNEEPFKDIAGSQYKDYIKHLYYLGYIKGYEEDNTFRPENRISRAEFITLISRILDLKENPANRKNFADIDKSHWAYEDIVKVSDNNIIEGYAEKGERTIKPNKDITIAEVAKILDEAFNIKNQINLNYDTRFVKHWAKVNIQSLLNSDIINVKDGFYKEGNIDRPATRGEVAQMLSRTVGR